MFNRKRRGVLALCVLMSAMLAGCTGNTTPKEAEKEIEKEAVVEVVDEDINKDENQTTDDMDVAKDNIQTESEVETAADSQEVIDEVGEDLLEETDTVTEENSEMDWVTNLDLAADASQIIVVAASGNYANVTFHQKEDDTWTQLMETDAKIGDNGIGKTKEGDRKTPRGIYHFTMAFGKNSDPGSILPYTQVDERCFWVDDSNSAYYNRFVTTDSVVQDWNSAEKLLLSTDSYNYVLATDYNSACVPGAGSAIFMHCLPTGGAGCIAIPEADMMYIVQHATEDCVLYIDYEENIER